MSLARFGVSLDEDILKALDEFVIENSCLLYTSDAADE